MIDQRSGDQLGGNSPTLQTPMSVERVIENLTSFGERPERRKQIDEGKFDLIYKCDERVM